jgi:hypothetical protein
MRVSEKAESKIFCFALLISFIGAFVCLALMTS